MPHVLRPCLLTACLAAAPACTPQAPIGANDRDAGDASATGDAPTTAPGPHDRFSDAFVRAYCDAAVRCPDPASIGLEWRPMLRTVDRCVALFGPTLRETLRRYGAAVAAGRARYDEAEGRRCVEAVRAACTFDPEVLLGRYCSRAYVGTVASGGACRLTAECAGESRCQLTGSPCGACRPRVPLGGECPGGYDACARPASGWSACDVVAPMPPAVPTAFACREARLVTGASVGQPCGARRAADGALEHVVCADGAWCAAPRNGEGVCRAHLAAGASCVEGEVCAGTARCVVAPGGAAGTCRDLALLDAVGAPCSDASPDARCDPASGLRCAGGACQRLGDGGPGARCAPGPAVVAECHDGLACLGGAGDAGACRALLPAGAACEADRVCASGWCDATLRRCVDGAC